ncbi:hypothetical protein M3583_24560, partial [Bacillus subtilis]|nr:hypothetical protein [Bacillus subtilis]
RAVGERGAGGEHAAEGVELAELQLVGTGLHGALRPRGAAPGQCAAEMCTPAGIITICFQAAFYVISR